MGIALHRLLPRGSGPACALIITGASTLLLSVLFPTDPPEVVTPHGLVHRYAAMTAGLVVPAAGSLLARRLRTVPGWAHTSRHVGRAAITCWVSLLAFLASQVPTWSEVAARTESMRWHGGGLFERILMVSEIVMLMILAVRAAQIRPRT